MNCPTRVRNLETSTVVKENTKDWYKCPATAGCVQHIAVEDLVLSQEEKPKKHQSTR